MTVRLDADRLLHAVVHQMHGELTRQGVQIDPHLVDSAAQAALGAAYGDAAASALVARLGAQNPQLAAVLGTAFQFLKAHPGFWVGYYATKHHHSPLPHDHPWAETVDKAFGPSDAAAAHYGAHHHHHHHPGSPPPAAPAPAPPHIAGRGFGGGHGGGFGGHHGHHHHHEPPPDDDQGGEGGDYSAGAARRPAPPVFGPHPAYAHAPRPAAMYYGGHGRPPPPPPPPRPQPPYGGYGGAQQQPQAPYATPPAAPDYGAPLGDPSSLGPPPASPGDGDGGADPSGGASFDPSSLDSMYGSPDPSGADPSLAPPPATTDVSTAGYASGADPRWVRRTVQQWLATLQATPLPPGAPAVVAAARTELLSDLYALSVTPTAATARMVIGRLTQWAGGEGQTWALAIRQLFPQLGAWPSLTGYVHPGEILGTQSHPPAYEHAYGSQHPYAPHEAAVRPGWGHDREPYREPYDAHREERERLSQEAVQRMAYERENGVPVRPVEGNPYYEPAGQPAPPYEAPYAPPGHWGEFGTHWGPQAPAAPLVRYGAPAAPVFAHPAAPVFAHGRPAAPIVAGYRHSPGVVHSAPRGRRGGEQWWNGYGGWWGPQYVVDARNELEDAPFTDDVEPDNQRID